MFLKKRKMLGLIAASCAGVAFAFSGCVDYGVNAALSSLDFCSVLNCEGGTYFDLCGTYPLLADCPNAGVTTEE